MGQYLTFQPEIYLRNHEYYATKEEVLAKIEENNEDIRKMRERLFALVCGNPRDLLATTDCEGYEMDPVDVAQRRFDDILDDDAFSIVGLAEHNVLLRLLAEQWDTRDASEFEEDFVKPVHAVHAKPDLTDPLSSC